MPLSTSAVAEWYWWFKHLKNANQSLQDIPVDCTIQAGAGEQELSATDGNTPIGGRWNSLERNHFNVLELKTILLALKSNVRHNFNVKQVHILTDNGTPLACINNMGGMHSALCNDIAKRIREFAQNRGFRISSSHIPDVENTMADKISSVTTQNGCSPTNCLKFWVSSFSLVDRSTCLPPVSTNR